MLKVKLSSSDNISGLLGQTHGGKGFLGDCQFFVDDDIFECDYWVVFNGVSQKEQAFCPCNHIILVTGEPASVRRYDQKYLNQFSIVLTAQEGLHHEGAIHHHQALPWLLNKSYDELVVPPVLEKTKTLSLICSNKKFTKGHEERFKFALDLKGYFGARLDLYGRGIRDFDDKWDVIAPYKYSIAIENSSSKYYVTEKLWDNYLSLTYPFYYGCTNVGEYYPADSFSLIDIHDFEGTIDIIERVLREPNYYEEHLSAILEARTRYLSQYHILPQLVCLIKKMENDAISVTDEVSLNPDKLGLSSIIFKIRCISDKILMKVSR
ncbi:MAG: glycosyltransferase family 10 [Methanocorpusculum sp.]|uniref:glycosyltransferase family 10 domain-containing protein n=1 Tax=Methanocorpusculum sp. TaxID=2058474 RepID=UPI002B1FA01F|nr:glycosyltransferase family 10 [Methanocorpusculum sp.]MEA5086229.1 glycosyltransferase family 10 [Methanocorpusculum sp.]